MSQLRNMLRLPAVKKVTGLSASFIYSMISQGTFPPPVPIGMRAVAWVDSEVAEWQEKRIAARDDGTAPRSLGFLDYRQQRRATKAAAAAAPAVARPAPRRPAPRRVSS